jgi:hypothetical protein
MYKRETNNLLVVCMTNTEIRLYLLTYIVLIQNLLFGFVATIQKIVAISARNHNVHVFHLPHIL